MYENNYCYAESVQIKVKQIFVSALFNKMLLFVIEVAID